jgi:tetratricopeptide (TPR) repeat protein
VRADSTFGAMLSEAVRTGLRQSSAISVVPASDIGPTLQRMRRDPTTAIDLQVGRDLALRLGAKAVVDGDISGVTGGYLVSLRLVAAESGDELATFHAAADGPKALIEIADELTRKLRAKTGESLRGVAATPPLYWQTTNSIDALRAFSEGIKASRQGNTEGAAAAYRDAVKLDSSFAIAWNNLGITYTNLGLRAAADSAFRRAYALRDRLSEWERLSITATYFGWARRDPIAAMAAYQAILDRGDSGSIGNLATLRLNNREYVRAESLYRAIVRRKGAPIYRYNEAATLFNLGRAAEAESILTEARAAVPAFPLNAQWMTEFAYQRGDLAAVARLADSASKTSVPLLRVWGASRFADVALLRGQVSSYEQHMRDSRLAEAARKTPVAPIVDSILFAYRDVWMSATPAHGLARLDAALAKQPLDTSVDADNHYLAAITYAMGGRVDRARAVLARYDAGAAADTVQRRLDEPERHHVLAEIALGEKRWRDAITEFRRSDSTSLGLPADVCRICLYAQLGRAFDLAGQLDSATAMYERYLQTPYFMRGSQTFVERPGGSDPYWVAPITKRLGELYEQKGDRARAAANFARFVDLWSNADPEFQPMVAQARARLARLKVEGR